MYDTHNIDGIVYILIRDIAKKWYNTDCGRIPITEVKTKIIKNGFKVSVIRAKIKQGNSFMNRDMFAVLNDDICKIDNLFRSNNEIIEKPNINHPCVFYIIQKYPDYSPSIIKMGKTTRTAEIRSKEFNVYNAKILFERNIRPNHEKTLIDMIAIDCERLGEEEFWVEDMDALLERANKVLALLPEPGPDDSDYADDED